MNKILFIIILFSIFGYLFLPPIYAQQEDIDFAFAKLRNELLNAKIPLSDINSTTQTLKSLLTQGVAKSDLVNMVAGITGKGFASQDLNTFLGFASTLIASGTEVDEAAKVVLGGIDKGLAAGFKGGDLGLVAMAQQEVEKERKLLEEKKRKSQEKDGLANEPDSLTGAIAN